MMKCFQKWLDIYYRERNLEIKKKNEKDKPTAEDPSVTRKTSKEVTIPRNSCNKLQELGEGKAADKWGDRRIT